MTTNLDVLMAAGREAQALGDQLNAANTAVADLTAQLNAVFAMVSDLNQRLGAATNNITDLTAQLAASQSTAANLTAQLSTANNNVADLQTRLTSANAVAADLTSQLAAARITAPRFVAGKLGTIYSGLHRLPAATKETSFQWYQPGNAGNSGGSSTQPHGTYTYAPGDPAVFAIRPASPYDDFYLYQVLPYPATLPTLCTQVRTQQILPVDLANAQAYEYDYQISAAGKIYNMGWQFDFAEGNVVRYFDYAASMWRTLPSVPMPDFTKKVTITTEHAVDFVAGTTKHLAISFGSQRFYVNIEQTATTVVGAMNKHTHAIQLDARGGATPPSWKVLLHDVEVRFA